MLEGMQSPEESRFSPFSPGEERTVGEVRARLEILRRDLRVLRADGSMVLRAMGGVVRSKLQEPRKHHRWGLLSKGFELLDKALAQVNQTLEEHSSPDLSESEEALFQQAAPELEVSDWREAREHLASAAAQSFRQLRTGSLSTVEAARRLDVNDSRIRQRLLARTLFGFKDDGDEWRLPLFQFDDEQGLVPGISKVFPHLPNEVSPVLVAKWFTQPNSELVIGNEERTPIEWLKGGNPPKVVADLAAQLGITP